MPGAANTYTTYLRSELDPATRQSYSQLRGIAEATYRDIGRFAQEASNTTAAAFGDRRATAGLRNLEGAATSAFGGIRREAATASAAVSAMQARLSSIRTTSISGAVSGVSPAQISTSRQLSVANDNVAASNRRVAASSAQVTAIQQRQAASTASLAGENSRAARSLTVLGTTLSVVQGPLGPIAGRINAITSAVTTLGTGTLVLAGAATALFAFAGVANVYAEVESRLKPLYTSQSQVNAALRETGRIALATRSALAPTADLYAKLTSAGRDFNISGRSVSRVTETAAKAATLSGGNAASREAGLYQFSQGLASGKLGGDELRSILENIPELARAIAAGFKTVDGSIGVTTGELRKLGAEGKLTTTAVVDALNRSASQIDAKFSKLPKTIGSARTEFVTAFTILTGQVDQTVGVTSTLANTISTASQNLQVLIALGGALAARFILPKLGAFLAEQRTAILQHRQLAAQTAQAQGRLGGTLVTTLTPTGIAQAKAATNAGNATAAVNDARARVAAEQQVVSAIEQEIAATRAAAEADREKSRAAAANARFDVAATEQRVAALRAELAVRAEAKALAQTNVATFATAAPLVNRPLAVGEQDAARTARITQFTEQQTAAKLELAQADLRASATARALAAAEIQLEGATTAATAATLNSTQAANQSAARGFALLGLAEQRAAANVALAASTTEVTAAETAQSVALGRLTIAQNAFNAASGRAAVGLAALRGGASALLTALGGPLMIAITAVTGALIYLAGQSNAALDALHNFAGGQEELERRLGITTDKLREQSKAARDLALALAQANVVKARTARADANTDLAASVGTLASNIAPGVGGRLGNAVAGALPGLATAAQRQQREDSERLFLLQKQLASGAVISARGREVLNGLLKKYPSAAADAGFDGTLNRFAGRAAGDTAQKVLGTEAARLSQFDAEKTLAEVKAELAKPPAPPRKPAVPLTPAQILAQGSALGATINGRREINARRFEQTKERILKDPNDTEQEKIDKIADATAAYNEQTAALDRRDARAAKAISAKADREAAKAAREAEAATKAAATATEKLADLRARYDEQPRLVDQVRNDQRAFQALIGTDINVTGADGKTKRRAYTAADAAADSARAQDALNKPFTDMTKEMDRQAQIQSLILQGRDAEADALGRAFQLIDRTGTLEEGQYATLVRAARTQEEINARIADRQRIVSTLSGAVDDVRQATNAFLNDLPNGAGRAAAGLGKNLLASFKQSSNQLLTDQLFGGVQKRIDDLISGKTALQSATAFTAQQTVRTGTAVERFGDVVTAVTERVEQTLNGLQGGAAQPVGGVTAGGIVSPFAGAELPVSIGSAIVGLGGIAKEIDALGDKLAGRSGGSEVDENGDIIVTARKPRAASAMPTVPGQRPITLREIYNETGRGIGEKIDAALGTKFAGKVGAKLGDALQGAAKGQFASGVASSLGIKQSKTGAAIGGAAGSFLPIPFGAEIGGLIGGTIGGLFKKTAKASAGIALNQFGELGAGTATGTSSKLKAGASSLAGSVASGLQQIADQLGATLSGSSNVQIGTYKDKIRVSTNGTPIGGKGSSGAITFADEQSAVEYAIRDALTDGILSGISQASQNILRSGQDLQKAISKALLIESIPKRLLAATDPVRAAVEDLNKQYGDLIAALNEGGATAQQYADAQKLYEIDRAKALADAQKAATGAIDAYLKEINGGSSSPLNKRTVYENASADFNKYAADIRAGKTVDQEDFVAAAQKFQDASRALNGSSSSFFSDFDTLRNLLTQAKTNSGVIDSSGNSNLPGSPFQTPAIQSIITQGSAAAVRATQDQTAAILAGLGSVVAAIRESTDSPEVASAIDGLPGWLNVRAM